MDAGQFRDFVTASAVRAVSTPGRIGGLVLTQTTANLEPKIREPEMRHAMAQEAESRKDLCYGIEVPTREKFRFTDTPGEDHVSARHDFVVMKDDRYDAPRFNLVELKEGQPTVTGVGGDSDCRPIRKDFQKLILEIAEHGKSIVHILHAAKARSIRSVLGKYNIGLWQGVRRSREEARLLLVPDPVADPVWFTLFILVLHLRDQGDRPFLYHQHLDNFGAALQRAENRDPLFCEGCLVCQPLDEAVHLLRRQGLASAASKILTPEDVDRQLLARGLLSRLPDPAEDVDDEDEDDLPVPVEGESVSETLVRERR